MKKKSSISIALTLIAILSMYSVFAAVNSNSLNSPADLTNTSNSTIMFTFTPVSNSTLENATIYSNWGGSWAPNATNQSVLANGTANEISVNGIAEGTWFWNVLACDNENCSYDSANKTLTVDRTAPLVIMVNSSFNTTDTSPEITFNYTDNLFDNIICTLYEGETPYNTSDNTINNTNTRLKFNTTLLDGNYFVYVNCTDKAGNVGNSTLIKIIIDNVAPTMAMAKQDSSTITSLSISVATSADVTICTTSRGSISGAGASWSISNTGLGVGTTYSYTVTCNSSLQSISSTASFTTDFEESSGTTTSSGSSGSGYTNVVTHNLDSLGTEEKTFFSKAKENIKFKITTGTTAGTTFSGTVDNVTSNTAILTFALKSGTNKEISIFLNDEEKIDLDEDGTYDISITLDSIVSGEALFLMKEIEEKITVATGDEEGETAGETTAAGEEEKAEEVTEKKMWLYAIIGAVVVAVIIAAALILQRKKSPFGAFLFTFLFAESMPSRKSRKVKRSKSRRTRR